VIPTDTPLPENTEPAIAVPLVVTVPPNATPEERRDALREALREALVPEERIESIVELLDIDATGQVYITPDGMDQLRNLLEDLEIPEGAEKGPLAVFKASLGGDFSGMRLAGNDKTAVLFFLLPEGFVGKTADKVHVVKMLASDEAIPFTQVFAMEDLKDGCSAVAEIEPLAGGDVLKRLLASKDLMTPDCLVALAIMDGGSFDLDGMVNDSVTDPAFVIEAEEKENPEPSGGASGGSSGGCSVGFVPLATLLLALPLVLLKK
jgi:Synergist-CTERM protein sorting domain-containing protein